MKNRVMVRIANREYTLLTEEEEEYVIKLAKQLDKGIQEMSATARVSLIDALVLTSFNIADKMTKALTNAEHLREQIKVNLDENQKLKSELAEARREISRLNKKISAESGDS